MPASTTKYTIEKLHIKHINMEFDCGEEPYNDYFFERSYADVKNNNAKVYVFVKKGKVIGFYSISSKSVRFKISEDSQEQSCPVLLIGQLAVNKIYQRKGWGPLIIQKAFEKGFSISQEIGCVGIVVETYKAGLASKFYTPEGFTIIREDSIKNRGLRITLFKKFPETL